MLEYYQEFVKQKKSLHFEPQLSEFYHASEGQKNGELLFVTVGSDLAMHASNKYLKQMSYEKLNEVHYQPDHL